MLDAISIIADTDGTGQMRATEEEVFQCLLLLLTSTNPATLVFDGPDECTVPPGFFKTVYDLCCRTGAKALFLGRRNCELSRACKHYTTLGLKPWQNVNDIWIYFQPGIDCIQQDGLLPTGSNLEDIVTTLLIRAQGMFLWARLVIRYLSNVWLSPRERIDSISHDTRLDGLENVYGRILGIL